MLRCLYRFLSRSILVVFLTVLTQIGGLVWIIHFIFFRLYRKNVSKLIRIVSFLILYLISTLLIVPPIAKQFGRIPLNRTKSNTIIPHNYSTVLLNRNYVRPKLSLVLNEVANEMHSRYPEMKISYLDACFPFIDRFPLLPHLSHHDGKKVDLSFMYKKNGAPSNEKPSWLGYGVFEEPRNGVSNTNRSCKSKNRFYDFSRYLHFGKRAGFEMDEVKTKAFIELLLHQDSCHKLFLEPHLKSSMNINHPKLRFQGCHSVRHDDHIHFQIH